MDILGDRPSGVPRMIYEIVRQYAAFYKVDRPLSSEVEAIESELGSEVTMRELISLAPLGQLDEFFALGPVE
jgi:histidine ammonia-lyase